MDPGNGTYPDPEAVGCEGRLRPGMKQDRKVWHQCEGCGRREKLSRRQKHWCPCRQVRYQMIWAASRRLDVRPAREIGCFRIELFPMTRFDILREYEVAGGLIETPGPFYREKVYVPYFWRRYLKGEAHEIGSGVIQFTVSPEDRRQFPELEGRGCVRLTQVGFKVTEA